jgi:hypothetical protein
MLHYTRIKDVFFLAYADTSQPQYLSHLPGSLIQKFLLTNFPEG